MITFDQDESRFNYRVGGLAVEAGRVLLQTADDIDFWVLPGGRAEFGESAADTLRREMREELGLDVDIGRLLWIVENFFTFDARRYHEVGFYFAMTVPPTFETRDEFRAVDGGTVYFRWHPLATIDCLTIKPSVLVAKLSSPLGATEHIVHVDAAC